MMKTKPITPAEVEQLRAERVIPQEVFEAFNELIAEAWDGKEAVVDQDKIVRRIAGMLATTTEEVCLRHWLDVEPLYQAVGWDVAYDKPGYNETCPATFTFRRRIT